MAQAVLEDPRTQVRGLVLLGLVAALAATLLAFAATVLAAEPDTDAADAAIGYVEAAQNLDGGFPAFGAHSTPGSTLDAVFAFVASGRDPTAVTNGGSSPADYLSTQAAAYSADPGAAAKLALGVALMGLDPSSFGGVDLLATMGPAYDPGSGAYGLDLFDEAFFILALEAVGEPVPAGAIDYLKSVQQPDGGWEFLPGLGSDTNTAAMVFQGLIAAGVPAGDPAIQAGLDYFASARAADGGFGFLPAAGADPSSTALAIQALIAAGEDIDEGGPWAQGGVTPMEGLLAFQNPATGAFQFSGFDSLFATYQALPALMLAPFPHLVTLPDGVTPPTPTPTTQPTSTPAPSPSATPTPAALSESEGPIALPDAGGEPPPGGDELGALVALLAMWSAVAAVAILSVRARQ
jgi:hypothetical protein